MREEGAREASKEAEERGEKNHLKRLVKSKLAKGKSTEVIADEVEETVDTVLAIIKELESN